MFTINIRDQLLFGVNLMSSQRLFFIIYTRVGPEITEKFHRMDFFFFFFFRESSFYLFFNFIKIEPDYNL